MLKMRQKLLCTYSLHLYTFEKKGIEENEVARKILEKLTEGEKSGGRNAI